MPALSHIHSAIDTEGLAGDITGVWMRPKIPLRLRDILCRSPRRFSGIWPSIDSRARSRAKRIGHIGFNEARSNRVDANVSRRRAREPKSG